MESGYVDVLLGDAMTGLSDGTTFVWKLLATLSAGASAYHGYKRNRGSIGWAIGWAAMGVLFPVITPAVALAEGFAKPLPRR